MDLNELKNIPVLRTLNEEQFEIIYKTSRERTFGKRENIFSPDDHDDFIMILLSGRVRIYLAYPDGKEFTVAFLDREDIYSSHSRTFAEAMEPSRILAIDRAAFQRFMINNPAILLGMVRILGESLGNTLRIIENLAFRDVDKRLASFLLDAVEENGIAEREGTLINLGLTVEDIASTVGSSRQTASMLLNRWEKEGVIKHYRKSVLVLDVNNLITLAGRGNSLNNFSKK